MLVLGLALAAGFGAAALVLGSEHQPEPTWASAVVALLVGWVYIGSGLVAWRHRSERRLGAVMVFVGFAWFVTFLADSEDALLFTLGTALENIYLLGFVYLVLSFPSGRLRGRVERVLFVSAIPRSRSPLARRRTLAAERADLSGGSRADRAASARSASRWSEPSRA